MQRIRWTAAVPNAVTVLIIVSSCAVFSGDDHLQFVQREAILFLPIAAIAISFLNISAINRIRAYAFIGIFMATIAIVENFMGWAFGYAVGVIGLWIGGYQEQESTKSEEQKLAEKWEREYGGPAPW